MPSGELCRPQINECDPTREWQWDISSDGMSMCRTGFPVVTVPFAIRRTATAMMDSAGDFGEGAKSASPRCYKEINSQGNRFGHCGVNGTAYLKCLFQTAFVGEFTL